MNKDKKYTDEELAEAFVYPVSLTDKQKREAVEQLAIARKKGQKEMTDNDRLALKLWQLKFQLEEYIAGDYDPEKHFGYFLRKYIDIVGAKRKVFADTIGIDETLLSQLIHKHRSPPDYMAIRLELHSNATIPAAYWYRLVEKEKEHLIKTDMKARRKESRFVTNRLTVSF
ncbi:hypothetical protein [Olivibacter sitiensis]|uniref:hypothetical protein n=1 Tax=Olivibacter sitiensis TaxID=376470 RepID=UPI0003F549D0|nr:hypothetical protein [Olivibacter sitiensis]